MENLKELIDKKVVRYEEILLEQISLKSGISASKLDRAITKRAHELSANDPSTWAKIYRTSLCVLAQRVFN